MPGPVQNTDRELYREDTGDPAGSYYENSVHVTKEGHIGMNVGGTVIVQPIADWVDMAKVEFASRLGSRNRPLLDTPPEEVDVLKQEAYEELKRRFKKADGDHDNVNHPSHYTAYKGLEVIDLTEQMNFNRGNAVKYIARAGLKDESKEVEDLKKAIWYLQREVTRMKGESE